MKSNPCLGCVPGPMNGAPFYLLPTATTLTSALAYAAHGWKIFPAEFYDDNGKVGKKSHKAAKHSNGAAWGMTADPKEIRRDFLRWPEAIGIPTGAVNGIFVVETDTPKGHDVDGGAALATLEAEHGALPATLMAESPSGSVHRYFRHPGDGKIKNSSSEIAPGVDIRGDGGMVVAPPSIRGDGTYRWLNNLPVAEPPEWLLSLVKEQPHEPREPYEGDPAAVGEIAAALAVIPNPYTVEANEQEGWDNWNRIGMATWNATGGSNDGFEAFDGWSKKSPKYNAANTAARWDHYFKHPPNEVGAGTIFFLANEADPEWRERHRALWSWGEIESWLAATKPGSPADLAMLALLGIEEVKTSIPPCGGVEPTSAPVGAEVKPAQPEAKAESATEAKVEPASEEPSGAGTATNGGQHDADEGWPTMAEAAYDGLAGEIVRTIEPHSEADPVALLIQLLVCFGNIVGRHRYFVIESTRHYSNLSVALVGRTSRGRKGTALDRIRAVVKVADEIWTNERIRGGLSSGEGLINEVRDPSMKWDAKENREVIVDAGVRDKRLLLVEPEFAGVLAVMERSGNTVSQLIRKAWDGERLATMTRNSPLTATEAHISVIGHITEDELRGRLTRTDMANGFANRFLFALIKRSKLLPFGGNLTDSEILHLGEELRRAVDAACDLVAPRLTMTEAARTRWNQVYTSLTAERPGLLGAVIARAEAQVVRLALLYALLDRATQIDTVHLEAGLAVWDYCEGSARRIFGEALGDDTADEIYVALVRAGKQGMSRTSINDLFGRHRSRGRIAPALTLLLRYGKARTENQPTRGRAIELWFAT
jgi:hypothetical protein